MTQRNKVHQLIADQGQEHLERLREFLAQPSVSQEGEENVRECAGLLLRYFQELGCQEAELVETPGFPAVWAYYDAGAAKTVAVYGYFDTNVLGDNWIYPPYEAVVAEHSPFKKVAYGPGAATKGGLVTFLNALSAIKAVEGNLPVNLMFVCEGEEWLGSRHIPLLIERYRDRLSKADTFLNPRPCQTAAGEVAVYLGNKGCLHIELECSGDRWGRGPIGRALHSSRQPVVDSPAWRLVHALATLYDPGKNRSLVEGFYNGLLEPTVEEEALIDALAERYKGREASAVGCGTVKHLVGDITGRDVFLRMCYQPTMNISGLRAGYTGPGTKFWTLPDVAYCNIDCRLPAELDPEVLLQQIRDHLDRHGYKDIGIQVLESTPSAHTLGMKDNVTQAALRVFSDWDIDPVIWPRAGAGGPTGHFSRLLNLKPLISAGMAHAGQSGDSAFLVVEGDGKVGGLVELEQSFADLLYSYAAYPAEFQES
jgi:acetylornithine deacetylase/succinyl-diaminopimelate desuccinylase-like protein